MILLAFDIDGTIAHYKTGPGPLMRTLEKLIGQKVQNRREVLRILGNIPKAGRTDPAIMDSFLEAFGLGKELREKAYHTFSRLYRYAIFRSPYKMCNGVRSFIMAACRDERFFLSILTGNFEPTARAKLRRVGLDPYFPIGAYGSDHPDRNALYPILMDRLRKEYPETEFHCSVIIGDTPSDIMVARMHRCASVAVTTGYFGREELSEYRPDLILDAWHGEKDLQSIQKICALYIP